MSHMGTDTKVLEIMLTCCMDTNTELKAKMMLCLLITLEDQVILYTGTVLFCSGYMLNPAGLPTLTQGARGGPFWSLLQALVKFSYV